MLLIPGALIGLITLHLYLVIRLGVTPPPWGDDAEPDEPSANGRPKAVREGLVDPKPRGNGGPALKTRTGVDE
jgi:hypothetical protein